MTSIRNIILTVILGTILLGCESQVKYKYDPDQPLPVIGPPTVKDGNAIPHKIPEFSFVDQDSNRITVNTFEGKIFVADFFFSTCPDICPKMSQQMLRVHDEFLENDKVGILSHSLDPEYDTPAVLSDYAEKLGVRTEKWHMVTGYDRRFINEFGQKNYLVTAKEDENAPGGILHSGHFILVDTERHIRGVYDGTLPEEVDMLIHDMKRLLNEG